MKYNLDFNLMEMTELVYACNHAIDREHKNFLRILRENGNAIRTLESVREKIFVALSEDNCHLELDLMEIVQLYSACNMAWHYEKDEMAKNTVSDWEYEQYARAVSDLEMAREKILAAMKG